MNTNKPYPVLFESKSECCGCTACFSICPQNAIVMKEDSEGFLYPRLDKDKCIKCYACMKVCMYKKYNDNNIIK